MPRFTLTRSAKLDLDEIWSYIAAESGSADIASRLLFRIHDSLQTLARSPSIGTAVDIGDQRIKRLSSGKYWIYYREKPNGGVCILRIIHGMRNQQKALRKP